MTNPLHASWYADRAVQETVTIVQQVNVARDTVRTRFRSASLARRVLPGQFLMLRLHGVNDPLIGRPLAVYDVVEAEHGVRDCVDVVYVVKGKFTTRLAQYLPGQKIDVWGPLGNGFPVQEAKRLILVAGGIGQTPFLAVAKEYLGRQQFGDPPRTVPQVPEIVFCYGARSADLLAGVEDFERLGVRVELATDDGSQGHHGLVTDVLERLLSERVAGTRVLCCGPEPMMAATGEVAARYEVPCQVSLETPMACGIGICFTCVARIRQADGAWDYQRTCVEGPVFDAADVVW